jgi:PP-loop superfamily ATP-utilizing enzyme
MRCAAVDKVLSITGELNAASILNHSITAKPIVLAIVTFNKKDLLQKVDMAETIITAESNLTRVRARVHENLLVRIELEKADLQRILKDKSDILIKNALKIKNIGFTKVCIDLEGYKTGSLNEIIDLTD